MMKILVVFPYQWGYNTDFLFFCNLLADKYEVTYIGYHLGFSDMPVEKVNVIHVKYKGKISFFSLLAAVVREARLPYTHLFVNYFLGCSLLNILRLKGIKRVVDIRTSFIYKSKKKTRLFNNLMRLETRMFKNITAVSEGVAAFLGLSRSAHILPLGAPLVPVKPRTFDVLNFIYIGTFYDRRITNSIHAFARFLQEYGAAIPTTYKIIGLGSKEEESEVRCAIVNLGLSGHVHFLGEVRYPHLYAHLRDSNVGISYIPITEYYQDQPPTKTFEYLMNGIPVLGTATRANTKVIDESNGVLTGDSVNAFYEGMVEIYMRRHTFSSVRIQNDASKYSWESIVKNNLIPYLKGL